MLKFIIPAIAALGLTAVAAQSYSPDSVNAPVEAQAMGWHLSHEEGMAKLAYGVENSDQLALMVVCEPGRSTATVYGEVQPAGARLAQASMGPTETDPLSGGDAYETRISLGDPTMRGLSQQGRLRVEGEAGTFMLEANIRERAVIGDFFAYCASNRA